MPQPPEVQALADELASLYLRVQRDLLDQLEAIAQDPNQHRLRSRLTEQSRAISQALDEVEVQAKTFLSRRFPEAYQYGAMEAARATGRPFMWTAIHYEAVAELANTTYADLLSATQYVRQDSKRYVRAAVRARTAEAVIAGRTAVQTGRALAKELEGEGIGAIRYANGAKHTLGDYADMTARTQAALAYNAGSLNAGREAGVRWVEVFDGAACGWSSHDDADLANGSIRHVEEAAAFSISHPRCARSFSPRPDLNEVRNVDRAGDRFTEDERQALATAERERARKTTVSGRRTARERQRQASVRAGRSPRVPRAARSVPRVDVYPGGLSAKEGAAWLEQRWPGTVKIHTRGMSDDVVNEIAATLDDLMRRHPDVARGISHIGDAASVTRAVNAQGARRIKPMSKRALAEARKIGDTSIIRFDVKNLDRVRLAALERDGFLARGSIDGVVRHEFGHLWHHDRFTTKGGTLSGFTTEAAEDVIRRTIEEFATPDLSGARSMQGIADVLSRYGATNEKEMLAEAFSDVMTARATGGTAHPFAETLVARLEAL